MCFGDKHQAHEYATNPAITITERIPPCKLGMDDGNGNNRDTLKGVSGESPFYKPRTRQNSFMSQLIPKQRVRRNGFDEVLLHKLHEV